MNWASSAKIDGKTSIDFTISGQQEKYYRDLQEETLSTGYGEIKRKDATTSVGKIDAHNSKFMAYKDIYEIIKGQLPGVEVARKSIRVAGASSFMLSSEPLFFVDGLITGNIDGIAPSTVKTIEVPEGPSASIYSIRGANGPI